MSLVPTLMLLHRAPPGAYMMNDAQDTLFVTLPGPSSWRGRFRARRVTMAR